MTVLPVSMYQQPTVIPNPGGVNFQVAQPLNTQTLQLAVPVNTGQEQLAIQPAQTLVQHVDKNTIVIQSDTEASTSDG